jgi:pyruvate formate lyase activating enzyme
MQISGLEKCSLVDYPGKLAAVVFLKGCNMNCSYCHNQELLQGDPSSISISEEDLFGFLQKRSGLLDAVVVTGGEPTLNENLPEFIRGIRKIGYFVKLDTNGTNPGMVSSLIEEGLLDYVAMDLKTIPEKYPHLCRTLVDTGSVVRSVNLLLNTDIEYEFRTTVYPGLSENNLYKLAELLSGARKWVLQHYSPEGNSHIDTMDPEEFPEKPNLQELASAFSSYTGECSVRGKEIPLELKNWGTNPDVEAGISTALDIPQLLS